ncbi:MAG: hypothetical protein Q8R39_03885 [bacterium]|nr:hypothetical protein [bacterium]MDZ4285267.1 hypothetical protein [Patescibacteria group bacterium]
MALPSVIEILVKDIALEFDHPETREEPPEVYLTSLLMAIIEDLGGSSASTHYTVEKADYLDIIAEAKSALESSQLPQTFLKRVEKERKINGRRQYYAAYKRRQRA